MEGFYTRLEREFTKIIVDASDKLDKTPWWMFMRRYTLKDRINWYSRLLDEYTRKAKVEKFADGINVQKHTDPLAHYNIENDILNG